MSRTECINIIGLAALGELIRLHILCADDGLRHDAAMPVAADAVLAHVVVPHADVMADHVRHCAGQKVRLVRVNVDADPDRLGRADRLRNGHARFAALERFAAEILTE